MGKQINIVPLHRLLSTKKKLCKIIMINHTRVWIIYKGLNQLRRKTFTVERILSSQLFINPERMLISASKNIIPESLKLYHVA